MRCLFDQEQETPAGQAQFVRRRSAVTRVLSVLGTVSLSGELGAPACLLRVRLEGGGGVHDALEKRKIPWRWQEANCVSPIVQHCVVANEWHNLGYFVGYRDQNAAQNRNVKIGNDTSEGCDRSEIWEQP